MYLIPFFFFFFFFEMYSQKVNYLYNFLIRFFELENSGEFRSFDVKNLFIRHNT